MRTGGVEVELEDAFQVGDLPARFFGEGRLAFEGVKDDSFDEIAQGQVVIVGESFQHLEETLLDPHAGLDALDGEVGGGGDDSRRARGFDFMVSWYICTTMYVNVAGTRNVPLRGFRIGSIT